MLFERKFNEKKICMMLVAVFVAVLGTSTYLLSTTTRSRISKLRFMMSWLNL